MKQKLLVAIFILPIILQACGKARPADIITKDPNDTPTHIYTADYLLVDSLTRNDSTGDAGEYPINRVVKVILDSNFKRLIYQTDTYSIKENTLNVYERAHTSRYDYTTVTVTMDSIHTYGTVKVDAHDNRTDYVNGYKLP